MYVETACHTRWAELLAPRTGSVGTELADDLARYMGTTTDVIACELEHATERFTAEWNEKVADPHDERELIRFYNESSTELFDLVQWHRTDAIHYRTLMCIDIARDRGARTVLDYGSGIGSDALALAASGFDVVMADISSPLLAFAQWRCAQRGFATRAVDLKSARLDAGAFDAAICFDVLEHLPRPLTALRTIHKAMRPGGLLFMHAPLGVDPDRPMHLVHEDVLTPRMRSVGFHWRDDLERRFPQWLWAPRVYEAMDVSAMDRAGYYVYDVLMPGRAGAALAGLYKLLHHKRRAHRPVV